MRIKDYIIKKVIFEVRYFPLLSFSSKNFNGLQKFTKEFTRFDVQDRLIELSNDENYKKLLVSWNKLAFTTENVKSLDEANRQINKYCLSVLDDLKVDYYLRTGLRVMYLIPTDSTFEELIEYYEKIINFDADAFNGFGNIVDIGTLALTLSKEKSKANLSCGPMKDEEVNKKVAEFRNYKNELDSYLFIDYDIYTEESLPLKGYIEKSINESRLSIVRFRDKLQEKFND
ncbi:MAG: hypothetical protein QY331_04320 [Melioribacteraceae bacterium]|nr:MAG: hypothetical protein QY331_04320 [Melioribacteraceae bacterium]